jgi:methyl-accepting chemotaxis protein
MRTWTVGKRIVVAFLALIVVIAALGAFSYARLIQIRSAAFQIANEALPGIHLITKVESAAKENFITILKHVASTSSEEKTELEKVLKETRETISKNLKDFEKIATKGPRRELFDAIQTGRAGYTGKFEEVIKFSSALRNAEALDVVTNGLDPAFRQYAQAIQKLVAFENEAGDRSGEAIQASVTSGITGIMAGSTLALVFGLVIAIAVSRSLAKILKDVSMTLDDGSNQVASAAGQVSASSQSLAEGASQQAASLEETSASLEEMSSMTKRNAENAATAKDLANQTRTAADSGALDMKEMTTAMDAIKSSSDNIAKIIKTIDEIAFQTNILALNAAVEAARAGEAGMGFAVVADEVRNLAQRSAQAAKETTEKIEDSIRKSEQGVEISDKVARRLMEIVEKARKVDELIGEIASASREQNQGIQQVNTAVTQMDKVTQSNAANAEESASASEELNAQAASLKESVQSLMKLVGGKAEGSHDEPSVTTKKPSPASKSITKKPVSNGTHSPEISNGNGHPTTHVNGGDRVTNGNNHEELSLISAVARKRDELPMDDDFKNF